MVAMWWCMVIAYVVTTWSQQPTTTSSSCRHHHFDLFLPPRLVLVLSSLPPFLQRLLFSCVSLLPFLCRYAVLSFRPQTRLLLLFFVHHRSIDHRGNDGQRTPRDDVEEVPQAPGGDFITVFFVVKRRKLQRVFVAHSPADHFLVVSSCWCPCCCALLATCWLLVVGLLLLACSACQRLVVACWLLVGGPCSSWALLLPNFWPDAVQSWYKGIAKVGLGRRSLHLLPAVRLAQALHTKCMMHLGCIQDASSKRRPPSSGTLASCCCFFLVFFIKFFCRRPSVAPAPPALARPPTTG